MCSISPIPRRGFLIGIAAAVTAPAIILTPGLLMPVRGVVPISEADHRIIVPRSYLRALDTSIAAGMTSVISRGAGIVFPSVASMVDLRVIYARSARIDEAA